MSSVPSVPSADHLRSLSQFTLGNGLRVVLLPNAAAPIVATNLWYHVGSKNERVGRTGFAHLFEHMLFQGSANVSDNGHFALIQQRGGTANGSTWFDRTNYFETLPARELELALWLESDRMGHLLGGLTQAKLDNQRDVVKNERRQRIDNQPYGTWLERAQELLFPAGHPYHWPVIGYMPDLDAANLDDVAEFFRTYYVPNNAVLSIVGDIEVARTTDLVHAYFDDIPRGAAVPRVDARNRPLSREQRATIADAVPLARVYDIYAVPAYGSDEFFALDFATDLLSAGKSGRLYRSLVHEQELAQTASAMSFNTEEVGMVVVSATARPGVELARLEAALDLEVQRLRASTAADAEVARVKNRIEAGFLHRLESAEATADLLSMHTTYFDDPRRALAEQESYRELRPELVRDAAARHLDPARRVRLRFVPHQPPVRGSVPAAPRAAAPASGREQPYRFPRPQRTRLPNGLQVVLSPMRKVPVVTVAALVSSGSARDPHGYEGLASLMTSLLEEGTARRDSTQLAEALESLGATFASSVDHDSSTARLSALARNFGAAWGLLGEILRGPSLPEREVRRLREERLARLLQHRADPGITADEEVERRLYPDHPYGHATIGTEESLRRIERSHVEDFTRSALRPDNTTLVIAGAIDLDTMVGEIERTLGDWPAGGSSLPPLPAPPSPSARRVYLIDRPGAAQSELRLGNLAMPRASDDYVPAQVMNAILGGKFTSRINLNLREKHGFTYGARSGFSSRSAAGPFLVSTAVHTDATGPALVQIMAELERIRQQPVDAAELDETRSYLTGVFPLTVETTADVVSRLGQIARYQLSDDEFDRYPERIAATTGHDIMEMARRYVRPDEMVIVVVGDAAKVAEGLAHWGPVTQIEQPEREPERKKE